MLSMEKNLFKCIIEKLFKVSFDTFFNKVLLCIIIIIYYENSESYLGVKPEPVYAYILLFAAFAANLIFSRLSLNRKGVRLYNEAIATSRQNYKRINDGADGLGKSIQQVEKARNIFKACQNFDMELRAIWLHSEFMMHTNLNAAIENIKRTDKYFDDNLCVTAELKHPELKSEYLLVRGKSKRVIGDESSLLESIKDLKKSFSLTESCLLKVFSLRQRAISCLTLSYLNSKEYRDYEIEGIESLLSILSYLNGDKCFKIWLFIKLRERNLPVLNNLIQKYFSDELIICQEAVKAYDELCELISKCSQNGKSELISLVPFSEIINKLRRHLPYTQYEDSLYRESKKNISVSTLSRVLASAQEEGAPGKEELVKGPVISQQTLN